MSDTGEQRWFFQLRVWHGMTLRAWLGMLRRHRWRVSPSRLYLVLAITLASVINSVLALCQTLLLSRKIDRVELPRDPIFVLGHWRSGTTLLHELLSLDPRHTFPSTYACLAPSHFLLSQRILAPWLRWLLPTRRSQDDVRVGFDQAQEDEWALCAMGLPSLYEAAAFPRDASQQVTCAAALRFTGTDRILWVSAWARFLKAVVFGAPQKRLVIKSPLHMARLDILLEVFPDARFVHVVRDPNAVFASTLRLWQRLAEDEGLQSLDADRLRAFVLQNYQEVFRSFEENRHLVPPCRYYEVRYEDLVRDPVDHLRSIYRELGLGSFTAIKPAVDAFVVGMASFRTNQLTTSAEDRAAIMHHWGDSAARHGYTVRKAA